MIQFDEHIFQNGLVQPPTSQVWESLIWFGGMICFQPGPGIIYSPGLAEW